jgi:hypothetical protein
MVAGPLLVKAMQSLSEEEQGQLLDELLARPAAAPHVVGLAPPGADPQDVLLSFPRMEELRQLPPDPAAPNALRVLPVRLPVKDYDRLRAWSREHGYSMAVIVRILVERFLDGQERRLP